MENIKEIIKDSVVMVICNGKVVKEFKKEKPISSNILYRTLGLKIAKRIGIDPYQLERIYFRYENGELNELASTIVSTMGKARNVMTQYWTTRFASYLRPDKDLSMFQMLRNSFRFDTKEGAVLIDNKVWWLSSDNYLELEKEALGLYKKNWQNIKEEYMKARVEYPVSIDEPDWENKKVKIYFHPVSEWEGDEWRKSSTRSMVCFNEVVSYEYDLMPFVDWILKEEIVSLFYKYAINVGELKEIEFADLEEEIEKIKNRKKIVKAARELAVYLRSFMREGRAEDFEDIIKLEKEIEKLSGLKMRVPSKIERFLAKIKKAKTFLVKIGDIIDVRNPQNPGEYTELLEVLDVEYRNIEELPIEYFEKYGLIDMLKKRIKTENLNVNLMVKSFYMNYYDIEGYWERVIRRLGGEVYYYTPLNIAIIKFTDSPEYYNRTDEPAGLIIGKGGRRIKEITRMIGVRFIKLLSD